MSHESPNRVAALRLRTATEADLPAINAILNHCERDIAILALSMAVWFAPPRASAEKEAAAGYIVSLPIESSADREVRHQRITARRAGPIVIVHRGASAFAPENTLQAYAAAMDYGADGCEIDIRATADGVLVLFHDDGLHRITQAMGRINQYTYGELAAVKFRSLYHATPATGIPTLAAVFELARQRAMLLHLDIKEPGLEEAIASLLDAAGVWDHVVAINDYNSAELRKNPNFKPLVYKSFGLGEGRFDLDPVKVSEALARPGNMVMLDDPRVAARELKRNLQCVPLPDNLHAPLPPTRSPVPGSTNSFSPPQFLRALALRVNGRSLDALEKLLTAAFPERADLVADAAYQRQRAARIVERAWAAEKIGQLGAKSARAARLLEHQVQNRSLHRDWAYQGLDGVMAARALGALRATDSVPVLARTFFAIDPELKKMVPPAADYPYAWGDFNLKSEIIATLGELPCEQSKEFLLHYLAMDKEAVSVFAPPLFEEATKAFLRQNLSQNQLQDLLRSTNSAIRGTAILECLNHPAASRNAALKAVLPWTQDLLPRTEC